MHFTTATIVAALAANVLAVPVPQIGGEAQFCQNVVGGVTGGVGDGTAAALNNVAGNVAGAKAAARWIKVFRRQGNGAAAACYDVVNNVDQGSGYATGNVLDGIVGDQGAECTGDCSVGNAKRQVAPISGGIQAVSGAAGTGDVTAPVTGALSGAGDQIDGEENSVGAQLGTAEAEIPSDTGAEIGNAIGDAIHGGATKSRRQLNKIAAGEQNAADSVGLGDEAQPVTDALDNIDGVGTGGVGNLGAQIGGAAHDTLVKAGSSVP